MSKEERLTKNEENALMEELKVTDCALVFTEKIAWIYGKEPELFALLTHIIHQMYNHGLTEKDLYFKALRLGLTTETDFHKVALEELKKILEEMEKK